MVVNLALVLMYCKLNLLNHFNSRHRMIHAYLRVRVEIYEVELMLPEGLPQFFAQFEFQHSASPLHQAFLAYNKLPSIMNEFYGWQRIRKF